VNREPLSMRQLGVEAPMTIKGISDKRWVTSNDKPKTRFYTGAAAAADS
jgi:hypothetical protein